MTIDLTKYEFVDFGCSSGASMEFVKKIWGYDNGIGIDIDPAKVEKTRALGYEADIADLTKPMSFSGKAKFSILAHVLEHIPNARMAAQILNTATQISSDFVFVRQPWFDCDGPLAQMGFKLYWSDWHGHTNHMTSLQMYLALLRRAEAGGISSFSVWGHSPIISTADTTIVPLESRLDRHHYDPETDPPKENAPLDFACFKELVAYVGVSKDVDTSVLPKPFANTTQLFHHIAK